MAQSKKEQPFVASARESYISAVKRWSRDATIAAFVLAFIAVFVVWPFTSWSRDERRLEVEQQQLNARIEGLDTLISGLRGIEKGAADRQAKLDAHGQILARDLSERLSVFGATVRALKSGPPVPSAEPFPGASMAQQMSEPNFPPGPRDPNEVLATEYGLASDEIELILSKMAELEGTPERTQAVAIVKHVFHREIERSYARLGERVSEIFEQLRGDIDGSLARLKSEAAQLGIALPKADQLLKQAPIIERPSDDTLFRTRRGKGEAMSLATMTARENIDAAVEPLSQLRRDLVLSRSELDKSLTDLERERKGIELQLERLETQLDEIEKKASQLAGPLVWFPMEASGFVRLYPTLAAIILFVLACRFARINTLGRRLERDYSEMGLNVGDVDLALWVPETVFDPFAHLRSNRARVAYLSSVTVAAGCTAVIALVIWRIQSTITFGEGVPVLINLPAIALAVAAIYVLGSRKPD